MLSVCNKKVKEELEERERERETKFILFKHIEHSERRRFKLY